MPASIIVTNDDGIHSANLLALADKLEARFGNSVCVIAPEAQQSATSHTITLHKPLRINRVAKGRYAASGTPVDCVYVGLLKMAQNPRLVISGINDGHNLGTDVFYSGTVGGAAEGGLRGIPSMAVSLAHGAFDKLDAATDLAVALAEKLIDGWIEPPTVLNVNIPANWEGATRWTSLGRRHYEDDVHERIDPRGRRYYWIGGGIAGSDLAKGSDCEAIDLGIASITPLSMDLTHSGFLANPPVIDLNIP